jgi:PhnB protein
MTSSAVKPIPDGFHSATPYLIIKGAAAAIVFYKQAFGATEIMRHADPDGTVRHAQIKIGDSPIMIADEFPEFPEWRGPQARGGSPVHIYLYVTDADAVFHRAIAAGATQLLPLQDQWYGDRSGAVTDPFGHVWYIATQKEVVSPEDIARRAAARGKK